MDRKKNRENDDLLRRLLQNYADRQIKEQPEKESEELLPSEDFCRRMEEIMENPNNWRKYMRRDRRKVRMFQTKKALALTAMALMLFLAAAKYVGPVRTSASIPDFILTTYDGLENTLVLKPNPDAGPITLPLENRKKEVLPEITLGYVPQGFVQESRDKQGTLMYKSCSGEAVLHVSVSLFTSNSDTYFSQDDAVGQIGINGREIVRLEVEDGVSMYIWREGDYRVVFYFCLVDEAEAEQVIKSASLSRTER